MNLLKHNKNVIVVLIVLLCVEFCFYYLNTINYGVIYTIRTAQYLVLVSWLFSINNQKHLAHVKYLYYSFLMLFISLHITFLVPKHFFDLLQLCFLNLSYLLIGYFFYQEQSFRSISNKKSTIVKVFFPFFLVPLMFYFFVLFERLQTFNDKIATFLVMLILSVAGMFSTLVGYGQRSRYYWSLAFVSLFISLEVNAYRIYILSFVGDYIIFRVFYIGFYFLLLLGIDRRDE